jgi:hypothetical protein
MPTVYDQKTGIWARPNGTVKNNCFKRGWSFGTPFEVSNEVRHYCWSPKLMYQVFVHRLIARMFCFKPKAYNIVDHIDGDCNHSAASNLRFITSTLNNLNRKRARNVSYDKKYKLWRARVRVHGKNIALGGFKYFQHAYKHAQAFKELLFHAIYLSNLTKDERQKAEPSCYLHGSQISFDLATELLDLRALRSHHMRRALQLICDIRAESDQKRSSFM